MFFRNLTQSLNISGLFSTAITSIMQQNTIGCNKAVNLLLPIGDWYEPKAKDLKVIKIWPIRKN